MGRSSGKSLSLDMFKGILISEFVLWEETFLRFLTWVCPVRAAQCLFELRKGLCSILPLGWRVGEGLPMHSRRQQATASFTHFCFFTSHNTSQHITPHTPSWSCLTRQLTLTTLCRKHQRASLDSWPRPSPGFLGPWRKSDGGYDYIWLWWWWCEEQEIILYLSGSHPLKCMSCNLPFLLLGLLCGGSSWKYTAW